MRFPPFRLLAFASVLLMGDLPIPARAEALLEKIDLFHAGENGIALYRIPGIVVTTKGTALAYCEARSDARSDWGEIQVHLRRSIDGGRTWSPAYQIAHYGERVAGNPRRAVGGENEQTVNNPVAIVDGQTGAVHFLYCLNYARCFYMRSDDDGLTFSAPVEMTASFEGFRPKCDWKVLATGPGHGLQLKNGRLVVPIWLAYGKVGDHAPSMSGTIYSDDHGKSWHAGEIAFPNTAEWKNPNETALVQLANGSVMLNARTQAKASRRLIAASADGATNWSTPSFDSALYDPMCMGSLLRLPKSASNPNESLLFSNPNSIKLDAAGKEILGARGERRNLTIKLSVDEGHSWPLQKSLEEGSSAYSDLALLPDETLLCFYERKNMLSVARFNREWLQTPSVPSAKANATPLAALALSEEILLQGVSLQLKSPPQQVLHLTLKESDSNKLPTRTELNLPSLPSR